jgi:hypothetical protein
MTNSTSKNSGRSRRIWLFRSLVVVGVLVAGTIAWFVYCVVLSLRAEKTLHAAIFTTRLVDQFVAENKRWPRSWGELETLAPSEWAMYKWPEAAQELRSRVSIDFDVDLQTIARQDPMTFQAIKPIGAHYEFRGYVVPSLQKTIRGIIEPAKAGH